jgi:hypothetical protein
LSHSKERKEKVCLNCHAELNGRYCHQCGQENIEPRQTVWHLITHFFYDITHFDGKFFTTLKGLLFKPGYLSKEFMVGRRQSYLDPVRMYLFTSAIFFILFFWLFNVKKIAAGANFSTKPQNIELTKRTLLKSVSTREDSLKIESAFSRAKHIGTPHVTNKEQKNSGLKLGLSVDEFPYNSFEEYDSIQMLLKPALRDGWITRSYVRKRIEITNKLGENSKGFMSELSSLFMHHLAQLLFVSLPIFALFLKLLYIRQKKIYYADHAIFSIHLYIFSFFMLMIYFVVQLFEAKTGWKWLSILPFLAILLAEVYYFMAMKNFYRQGIFKTIIKFLLLTFLSFIMMVFLFIGFAVFSLLEI